MPPAYRAGMVAGAGPVDAYDCRQDLLGPAAVPVGDGGSARPVTARPAGSEGTNHHPPGPQRGYPSVSGFQPHRGQ